MEDVTDFITDTVALARYLEDSLPDAASDAFGQAERGDGSIMVPQIVVGEFIYIAMKGRLKVADPKSSIKLVLDLSFEKGSMCNLMQKCFYTD